MTLEYLGEAAALLTSMVWAGSSQFNGMATRLVGVGAVTLLRIPYNIALLGLIFLFLRPANTFSPEAVLYILAGSFFGVACCDTSFYKAVDMIGPRLGCLVQSLSSCFTALLAYLLLGENLGLTGALGIVVAICGVFFVLADGGNLRVPHSGLTGRKELCQGAALALFSAVMLALSFICLKQALTLGISPLMGGLLRLAFGGIILGGFFWWEGWLGRIWGSVRHSRAGTRYMLIGGFFTAVGVWMSGEAVKYTEAGVAATIIALEPVMIIPINAICERKKPSARAVFGTLVAFGGVAVLILR